MSASQMSALDPLYSPDFIVKKFLKMNEWDLVGPLLPNPQNKRVEDVVISLTGKGEDVLDIDDARKKASAPKPLGR
jgi:hypothetical protein